jgi:hypothetical protein
LDVDIRAVIYIPDCIVVGIAFPKAECENEFPHLTLMVSNGWKPVDSNLVCQSTVKSGCVFEEAYKNA